LPLISLPIGLVFIVSEVTMTSRPSRSIVYSEVSITDESATVLFWAGWRGNPRDGWATASFCILLILVASSEKSGGSCKFMAREPGGNTGIIALVCTSNSWLHLALNCWQPNCLKGKKCAWNVNEVNQNMRGKCVVYWYLQTQAFVWGVILLDCIGPDKTSPLFWRWPAQKKPRIGTWESAVESNIHVFNSFGRTGLKGCLLWCSTSAWIERRQDRIADRASKRTPTHTLMRKGGKKSNNIRKFSESTTCLQKRIYDVFLWQSTPNNKSHTTAMIQTAAMSLLCVHLCACIFPVCFGIEFCENMDTCIQLRFKLKERTQK